MALFNNKPGRRPFLAGLSVPALSTALSANRERIYDQAAGAAMLGFESARRSTDLVNLENTTNAIANSFTTASTYLKELLGTESYTNGKDIIEAGARTAVIYSDCDGLKKLMGTLGFESFSNKVELNETRSYAIALAMVDAEGRSLSAINKVFPVIDMNADYVHTTISLPRYEIIGNEYHSGSGLEQTDWKRTHLVDAGRTSGLLGSNHNKMYPAVVAGENTAAIIPSAKVPHFDTKTSFNDSFVTGAVSNAASLNLMTLCRVPGMPAADTANYNDRIDVGAGVEAVYINLADDVVTEINTKHLSDALFGRSTHAASRNQVTVNLRNLRHRVDLTKAPYAGNAKLAALVTAGAKELEVKLVLNQDLNLHNGSLNQTYSTAVVGLYATAGVNDQANIVEDGAFTTALAALNVEYIGFRFDGRWSSRTVRIEGVRVDTRYIDKTFNMRARRVISADKEVSGENADDVLTAMNLARRLGREDDGFRFLLDSIGQMATLYGTDGKVKPDPETTQFAGAYYIDRAWVKDAGEVKLADIVKLEQSSNIQADIGGAISSLLGEEFNAMVAGSGLENVVRAYAPGAKIVPTILGPSSILRYIMREGDDRTFGARDSLIENKPDFGATNLDLMDETLIMVPQVVGGNDPLSAFGFGFTLECPALVYDLEPTDRNGGVVRALRMTPYYEFVINMPLAYKVKITEIAKYIASSKADIVAA